MTGQAPSYEDYRAYRDRLGRRGTAGDDRCAFPAVPLPVLLDWARRYEPEAQVDGQVSVFDLLDEADGGAA